MTDLIEALIKKNIPLTLDVGTVKKVSGDVCQIESLTTEKDFFKCRLNAIEKNENEYLKFTPKIESTVVFGIFKDTEKAIVISTSKVDVIEYRTANTHFKVDAAGYLIKRKEDNLKSVLNDFIDEVNKIIVIYGNTINVGAVTAIKKRLNNILIE